MLRGPQGRQSHCIHRQEAERWGNADTKVTPFVLLLFSLEPQPTES